MNSEHPLYKGYFLFKTYSFMALIAGCSVVLQYYYYDW